MIYNEDRQRLHEGRHDTDAAKDPVVITGNPAYQAAVAQSRGTLASCRTALFDAATKASREKGETDTERMNLRNAIAECIAWYGYIRDQASNALLKPSPKNPVSAPEIDRRRKLLDRVFPSAPSELSDIAAGSAIEIFAGIAKAVAGEPDLKPLGFADDMTKAHEKAAGARANLDREANEDSEATQALRDARAAFDRASSAHALMVAGVLKHEGKDADIGRYVLAKNPAYAARRTAGVPIGEEPDIEPLEGEEPEQG